MRSFAAILLLVTFIGARAEAGDKTISVLLPAAPDLHVYKDFECTMHLAPEWKKAVPSLGRSPIYDMREPIASGGVKLGPDDVALYSPESRLLFLRTSRENADMIETLYARDHCGNLPASCELDLFVRSTVPQSKEPQTVSELHFIAARGSKAEIASSINGVEKRLSVEFLVGPDGHDVEFWISGKLPIGDEDVALNLNSTGELGKLITVFKQSGSSSGGRSLQLDLRLSRKLTEEEKQETPEFLDRKLKDIEKEMRQ